MSEKLIAKFDSECKAMRKRCKTFERDLRSFGVDPSKRRYRNDIEGKWVRVGRDYRLVFDACEIGKKLYVHTCNGVVVISPADLACTSEVLHALEKKTRKTS